MKSPKGFVLKPQREGGGNQLIFFLKKRKTIEAFN